MQRIPLNIQTLYADLQQQVAMASRDEATVVATTIAGIRYLRLQRWVGASRVVEHLGRADDPEVVARADAAQAEMARRQDRRRLVSTLRRLIPGPATTLGKVLDTVSHAGLFRRGAVLVGTAAVGVGGGAAGRPARSKVPQRCNAFDPDRRPGTAPPARHPRQHAFRLLWAVTDPPLGVQSTPQAACRAIWRPLD